jgi:hypothetical protein
MDPGLSWRIICAVSGQAIILGKSIPETEYRRDMRLWKKYWLNGLLIKGEDVWRMKWIASS